MWKNEKMSGPLGGGIFWLTLYVRPSVSPSVRHTGGLVKSDWSKDYAIFTVQYNLMRHPSSICGISFIQKF